MTSLMMTFLPFEKWAQFHPVLINIRYRADWEPAAASGRRVPGVSWGCPAALWGPSTLNPTRVSWKTLTWNKLADFFLCACIYVVDWPHVAQVRFLATKRPHLERSHLNWQFPSSWDRKLRLLKKMVLLFMGQKDWVKKTDFSGVLDQV